MRLWKKVEEVLFTGEQLADYGVISDRTEGLGTRRRISALLARRSAADRFVIKVRGSSVFAGRVEVSLAVWYLELDRDGAVKLKVALDDALQRMK